jgi:hypothetical protein
MKKGETGDNAESNVFENFKVRQSHLLFFSLTLTLASTFQGGFALGENGQVGFILAEK